MSIFLLIVIFGIVPIILGQIWRNITDNNSIAFTYLSGFFSILACFEFFGVPFTFAHVPLHKQILFFSVFLFLACLCVIIYHIRKGIRPSSLISDYFTTFRKISSYEIIYLVIFFVLLSIQCYFALFYDIGTWRSDDFTYGSIVSSAVNDDYMYYSTDVYGNTVDYMPIKYALCSIYLFYAYLSTITSLSVPIITYTVCNIIYLLMAYISFYLLSKLLFSEPENRLIFLIFLSLLFIFGLYSHYSVTFRLIGVIWQGKAFLAVVVFPFLLYLLSTIFSKKINITSAIFLSVLSMTATSLTLGGVSTTLITSVAIALLYTIKDKKIANIIYIFAANLYPCSIALYYLLNR